MTLSNISEQLGVDSYQMCRALTHLQSDGMVRVVPLLWC